MTSDVSGEANQARWLRLRDASDANVVSLLSVELDQGEAEAIAFAVEFHAGRLLIDEREGRATARLLACA